MIKTLGIFNPCGIPATMSATVTARFGTRIPLTYRPPNRP